MRQTGSFGKTVSMQENLVGNQCGDERSKFTCLSPACGSTEGIRRNFWKLIVNVTFWEARYVLVLSCQKNQEHLSVCALPGETRAAHLYCHVVLRGYSGQFVEKNKRRIKGNNPKSADDGYRSYISHFRSVTPFRGVGRAEEPALPPTKRESPTPKLIAR